MKYSIIIFFVGFCAFWGVSQCSCDSLVAAIKAEDSATVRSCLESGTDPNCEVIDLAYQDQKIMRDDTSMDTIQLILKWQKRPIVFALTKDPNLLRILLDAGASPNTGSYCYRELHFDEYRQYELPPMELIDSASHPNAFRMLIKYGGLTEKQLKARGRRIVKLSTYYKGWGACSDSIQLMHRLLEVYGESVLFKSNRNFLDRMIYNNDIVTTNYLLTVKEVTLKEDNGDYFSSGAILPRGVEIPDFSPVGAIISSDYLTISTLLLLLKHSPEHFEQPLKDNIAYREFTRRKATKQAQKYFTMFFEIEENKSLSKKEIQRMEKRMQRIYNKLEKKNSIEARLQSKAMDCERSRR